MPFRNDAQRKAAFANMDNPSGSSNPKSDSSLYSPPLLHKSSEPENARNVNRIPKDFHYPDQEIKPSYSTKSDLKHDIGEITKKDDSLHHAPDDYDDYKKDVNTEMDNRFDHDYHRVIRKAAKEYRKQE